MSKNTSVSLTRSGTGCFLAVLIWQQRASKGYDSSGVCDVCHTAVYDGVSHNHSSHNPSVISVPTYIWFTVCNKPRRTQRRLTLVDERRIIRRRNLLDGVDCFWLGLDGDWNTCISLIDAPCNE